MSLNTVNIAMYQQGRERTKDSGAGRQQRLPPSPPLAVTDFEISRNIRTLTRRTLVLHSKRARWGLAASAILALSLFDYGVVQQLYY